MTEILISLSHADFEAARRGPTNIALDRWQCSPTPDRVRVQELGTGRWMVLEASPVFDFDGCYIGTRTGDGELCFSAAHPPAASHDPADPHRRAG